MEPEFIRIARQYLALSRLLAEADVLPSIVGLYAKPLRGREELAFEFKGDIFPGISPMKRVAVYLRVSTSKQDTESAARVERGCG